MTDMPTPLVASLEEKWLGPVIMFVLCFSGMMIGLAIDLQSVLPQTIVTLCTQRHSLGDSIALHATLLPATNVLMFASGLVAAFYSAWPSCGGRGVWRGRFLICCLPSLAARQCWAECSSVNWFAPQAARSFGMT